MKKFTLGLAMFAIAFGASAQGIFTPVGWFNAGNWPTAEAPAEMSDTPYAKKTATALKAGFTVDVAMLDEIGIADIWDRMGDEQFVEFITDPAGGDLYDLGTDDTYGASFKAFWDDDNLYTVVKFVDVNGVADADSRTFEIAFQTKEKDRYEAGFAAATTLGERNNQYAAYVELGAGKALWTGAAVTETARNIGQTGAWGSSIGVGGTVDMNWNVDQDGTAWGVLAMSFADYLIYLDDEWGANEAANHVALDPTVKTAIAWDVKSNTLVAAAKMEYFWSSNDNNGYHSNYFNGYLEFSETTFVPVSAPSIKASNDKMAYVYDNTLRMKGFDGPVSLEIYSIVGQKVMTAENVSTVNVSQLESGIYLVKVAGEKQAFKVIK